MPATKLHITNQRALAVLEYMVEKKITKSRRDALLQIGFNPSNFWKLENGEANVSVDHIDTLCRISGASADYIFGYSSTMLRKPGKTAMLQLKEAVKAIEHEMKK